MSVQEAQPLYEPDHELFPSHSVPLESSDEWCRVRDMGRRLKLD